MRASLGHLALAVLVLVALSGGAGAIETGVLDAEFTGPGAAGNDTAYVWAGEQPELTVEVGAPVFEADDQDYRHYDIRVTDEPVERITPTTTVRGETRVTLPELGAERVTIELDRAILTETEETETVDLVGTDQPVEVAKASVFIGVYQDGRADRWTNETVEVLVIRKTGDLDSDGLQNVREINSDTGLLNNDTDGDGLEDGVEVTRFGTDPLVVDTDGDDIDDADEIRAGTDPTRSDTDGDGISDYLEVTEYPTDPTSADTDDDGIDDPAELAQGTDPADPDTDSDGLDDGVEVELGTDPTDRDTDGDGVEDAWEVERYDSDPTVRDADRDDTQNPGTSESSKENLTGSESEDGTAEAVDEQRVSANDDPIDYESKSSTDSPKTTDAGTQTQVEATDPISPFADPLQSGSYAPFAAILGALGLRRLVDWVTYP